MSKSLKKEYRALAENDIPDLWNRIEAGLMPRNTASLAVHDFMEDTKKDTRRDTEGDFDEETVKKRVNHLAIIWYQYQTVIVAAMSVIVVLPAIIFGAVSLQSSKDAATKAESIAEEVAAAEAFMAAVSEEAAYEEAAPAAPEEADYAAEEPATGAMAEDTSSETMNGIAASDANEELRSTQKNQLEESVQFVVLDQVQILFLSEAGSKGEETGTLYRVKVIDDPGGTLAPDTEIELYIPEEASGIFQGDETAKENETIYIIRIQYDESARYQYTLLR